MGSRVSEASSHYIEFRNVYKTFDRPILVDINFHVDAGETLAIIGRSGVGKSVSLGHIMGFIKPDSGLISVAYTDMTNATETEWRRTRKRVTMVFQSGALFDSLTDAVTHDLELMYKVAARVMFLFEGKAIFFGPIADLEKSDHPHIQEFLEMDKVI